jgi:TRAP-type C4-dicarboxylate transport system permease small subunit
VSLPPGPQAAGLLARAGRVLETSLLSIVLGGMVLLAATQIVLRNVWGTGLDWADEALRLMVLWVTMLGAIAASGEQRHVSIDALSRYLPAWAGRLVGHGINALAAAVCAVLAWSSWEFVAETWAAGERVLGGRLVAWAAQAILPAGFALIALRYLLALFRPATPRPRGNDPH